jgi:hypothetical protein
MLVGTMLLEAWVNMLEAGRRAIIVSREMAGNKQIQLTQPDGRRDVRPVSPGDCSSWAGRICLSKLNDRYSGVGLVTVAAIT